MLDTVYLNFEDRFRGTREDVQARLGVYIPEVLRAVVQTAHAPVLDIGCGRGEWLRLLEEHQIQAIGVDLNEAMVSFCKSLDLNIRQTDGLEYLREMKSSSLSAITAFHVIEHLPFRSFIALVDEALRVLKPGGMLLFETPNPANILVATNSFYSDPTHLKPMPSAMVESMLEARGFVRTEVKNLHPHPNVNRYYEQPILNEFNYFFYGPQDYGVIAWKPGGGTGRALPALSA
ncbi:WbbD domain-containing protein [Skermanella stibiiresistens SB22]|uniref:WbbD domain-containing protein n=2 Tax=Skermanella TaxID=204447 RepID=W9H906_9PROT|nr:WbbD domain-containing protein [Skermanella stibiiresistens SB22]